ncbi:ImmA/IrrE family metallo-endopeptidase [Novosphingobium sp.]|uniref:ImmA/IrrE family metallo-endopeptidase n=1 Tax=Novosphingobium sp. TaxID=1874826 RepID=UPI003D0AB7DF
MPTSDLHNDPAFSLWMKVNESDFQKIENFMKSAPVKIGLIAEALSIEVESTTLPPNISGSIRRINQNPNFYKIEVNNTDVGIRQRFTVSHEISHYLLHRPEIDSTGITDTILYRSNLSDKKEIEANRLAAAILMPWQLIHEWHIQKFGCDPVAQNITEMANAFRVSSLSVGYRLGL